MTGRALYLDLEPDPVFAMVHEPTGAPSGRGIVMCGPFGWEDMASYRARADWADALARAGSTVLRFDPPGAGDSGGSPSDPGRVDAWLRAIDGAARHLRAAGCTRVAGLGLGLGGLLALAACDRGAPIDELVLWGARAGGRRHVRELRAFSRAEGALDEPAEGGLAVAGYRLTAETVAALEALDVSATAFAGRVLLLERDGVGPDPALRTGLDEAGADVTEAPGQGFGDVFLDWEHHDVPASVVEAVTRWVAAGGDAAAPAPAAPGPATLDAIVPVPGVRERPVALAGGMFGVLAEPADGDARATVVLLNAGLQRRTGPNRMWVEMARRWGTRGVATLRLDVAGLGDSAGNPNRYAVTKSLYDPAIVTELCHALDDLPPGPPRSGLVLGGLCAGAYWSFHAAIQDERVAGALMLNPAVLAWDQYLAVARGARTMRRKLLRPRSWARALTGRSDYRVHLQTLHGLATARRGRPAASSGASGIEAQPDPMHAAEVAPLLDRLEGKPAIMVFAGFHQLHDELRSEGILERLGEWPGVRVEYVETEAEAHTLRPLDVQRRVHELADAALDELLSARR